jgi:hypothetical protein
MAFAKGRPSPYHPTPCLALSRDETTLYQSTHLKDIIRRQLLFNEIRRRIAQRPELVVVDFHGTTLEIAASSA